MTVKKTGGAFNPADRHIYFLAANMSRQQDGVTQHDYVLMAVNELENEDHIQRVEQWLGQGVHFFLDSGIFNLTMTHVRNHPGLTMDDALALAPDEIDGFDALFERYVMLVERLGDRLWGYIELDQGGRENKIKTRARLEAMGLRPIPVYHPFNDGWDYFDELASQYDRICFGNVVQAAPPVRKRLVATAWQRKQQYPHLWVHLLGLTPNQWLNAYPIDSGDSSSWLSNIRWSGYKARADGQTIGNQPKDFQYELGSDADGPTGSKKSARLSAYGATMQQRNWRYHMSALERFNQ